MAKPDLTSNYAQANMLKMLRTAKDLVSTANVESSLDNATKTIEHLSRHGGSLPLRVPQISTESVPGGFAYITENHSSLPQRSLTPPLVAVTSLKQHRSMRPTPLRYTLPTRSTPCLYDRQLPVSSLSNPHLAVGEPLPHQHPHHYQTTGRLYVDSHSPFVPYGDLQLPDIYASHSVASPQNQHVPVGLTRRKRRSKSFQCEEEELERRKHRDQEMNNQSPVCMSELKVNHLQENHLSAASAESIYTGEGVGPRVENYGSWPPEDLMLRGRRRHRRPSFLKATWGSEQIRQLDESQSSLSSQSPSTLPDLFPCILTPTTPAKASNPAHLRNNLCLSRNQAYLHIRQDQRRPTGRKGQRLRYSHSAHLPTYGEAVRHGTGFWTRDGAEGYQLAQQTVRPLPELISRTTPLPWPTGPTAPQPGFQQPQPSVPAVGMWWRAMWGPAGTALPGQCIWGLRGLSGVPDWFRGTGMPGSGGPACREPLCSPTLATGVQPGVRGLIGKQKDFIRWMLWISCG
ncbi:unnamed protein product [Pleuronectes platessa]|uniref:Uncharacterized protein n=1 Tax=Pleuronectes platessa TaxID=8262 RepID=A0A9N7TWH7_PLEPL|nr:unnamed protein product [Pleuronectes platessa]